MKEPGFISLPFLPFFPFFFFFYTLLLLSSYPVTLFTAVTNHQKAFYFLLF